MKQMAQYSSQSNRTSTNDVAAGHINDAVRAFTLSYGDPTAHLTSAWD